jgi:PhnB protein
MIPAHSPASAPERYRFAAIPHLMIAHAAEAIEFYEAGFGASEIFRVADPVGKIIHSEMVIQNSVFMVGDCDDQFSEPLASGGTTVGVHIYVDNVDALAGQAEAAGASILHGPQDMFYGDRMVMLKDPYGHIWVFLQHMQDLSPDEIVEAANTLFAHAAHDDPNG